MANEPSQSLFNHRIETLRKRLISRGTDAPEVIECRLAKAEYELSFAPQFDIVIINDNLQTAQEIATKKIRDFINKP